MTYFDLHSRDILQIDATIITGILILLTLSVTGENVRPQQQENAEINENVMAQQKKVEVVHKYAEALKTGVTISIIIPFAVSAILVINDILSTKPNNNFQNAIRAMKLGFGYIIVGISGIAIIHILFIYSPLWSP